VKKKKIKVLSLFDGMSCGQLALKKIGINIDKYYASEIDKYAIKVTQRNFPDTKQLGDVTKLKAKSKKFKDIDLLIAGSPCQGFSVAGKQLNFDDPRSKLFFDFVRILKKTKPKFFLLENVWMKQEWQDIITEHLGVEPIEINSNLVSAQNRRRLYWTNIPNVEPPKDKKIFLRDILEDDGFGVIKSHGKWQQRILKSQCLDANYFKGVDNHGQRTMVTINYSSSGRGENGVEDRSYTNPDKAHTLPAAGYSTRSFTGVVDLDRESIRKLSPLECERLQTVPEDYTDGVSNSQRYKMLGNGWTVDVIAHIFRNLPFAPKKKKKKLIKRY
jgi:site-specific DNA-cytosine methylase